jgi:Tfp pilus assembly protein FimT
MGKNLRNNRGFTVMELMVITGVALTLMAVATPALLDTLPSLRLTDAARQVAADLQQIRMKAIAQNTPYQMTFSENAYVLQRCSGLCANDSGSIALPDGISVTASPAPQFQPRGTAAAAAMIALSNGSESTWVCVRAVGRVNIQNSSCWPVVEENGNGNGNDNGNGNGNDKDK